MSEHNAKNIPTQAEVGNKASWYLTVIELASKGVSNKAIAARLGLTPAGFDNLVEYEQDGVQPVKVALALARAEFEISRVEMKDAILNDPEISGGLKYKIVREDLKTLEEWAPATRAMKVQIEKGPTEFKFEEFSAYELEQIAARGAATEADNNNSNDAEENSSAS